MERDNSDWTPKRGFQPGAIIDGRYQVSASIGVGGMGSVLKVHDSKLQNHVVALKVLNPRMLEYHPTGLQRLANEVLVARNLSHPNIVRIHDIGETPDGFAYITMEYVDGYSLDKIIREKDNSFFLDQQELSSSGSEQQPEHWISFDRTFSLLCSILKGVGYAHQQGVVHRDLKPANILISKEGEVKIVDFGLARMHESDLQLTKTGDVVGTPSFMAPEQFNGETVDERSDIYAVSIIAYELLTGTLPFNGKTYLEIALKQISEPFPCLVEQGVNVPPWFQRIICKAGAKKQEDRFQSADQMYDTLMEHLHEVTGEPTRTWASGKMFATAEQSGDSGSEMPENIPLQNEITPKTGLERTLYFSIISAVCLLAVVLAVGAAKFWASKAFLPAKEVAQLPRSEPEVKRPVVQLSKREAPPASPVEMRGGPNVAQGPSLETAEPENTLPLDSFRREFNYDSISRSLKKATHPSLNKETKSAAASTAGPKASFEPPIEGRYKGYMVTLDGGRKKLYLKLKVERNGELTGEATISPGYERFTVIGDSRYGTYFKFVLQHTRYQDQRITFVGQFEEKGASGEWWLRGDERRPWFAERQL